MARVRGIVLGLTLATTLIGHGDIQEQIVAVTRQLQQDPSNAVLYLKRGELYRAVREWERALSDYDRAAQLRPDLPAVDLARGRTLLAAGRPEPALGALDRFLTRQPGHVEGLLARARALARLGRHAAAEADFTRAIERIAEPRPEPYLERAQVQVAQGRTEDAIGGLDEGIRRLGPVVTLELAAIDLDLEKERYDSALARLARITAQAPRKDAWLARRGDILTRAGRAQEARAAYAEALSAVESLPPYRRQDPATAKIEKRLREALRRKSAYLRQGERR